ncbi:OLC1v1032260C1 [Oldenlandia corymbosa var. corymbosa]|uniref:OLC1v1032260C1 n=1 Tax=Oldenlandia corymbosa var. corymbosa TaxID=529605 RepID=A0AAV1CKT0_OLDCO|nr:OLC1v1032260C1 [Oldenlandia corymbosa var. corymbosa]
MERERVVSEDRRVMVAIDEHEGSFYALEWALKNLHESIANSHLVVFTAQPTSEFSYIRALEPRELKREIQEDQKKAATALLENAREVCNRYGVTPELITEVGNPKDAIKAAVDRLHINLLIVGSHGEGAFKRAFLGSVTNYLVHNVHCQVLVVKTKPT